MRLWPCIPLAVLAAAPAAHSQQLDVRIDGRAMRAAPLDVITTPTGEWPVFDLGEVADGRAYRFAYAGNPRWYSVCIVRWPDSSGKIDDKPYSVEIAGRSETVTALPGSMKCSDNGEAVKPTVARVREAVRLGRVLPFDKRAFDGWPRTPPLRMEGETEYDPARIYGRSSMNNAIGAVGGAGGEYSSSRGFVSGEDAALIAAAMAGKEKDFAALAARNRVQMLYGLSLPNLVIWSRGNHVQRDPQLPLPGDRPYANEGRSGGRDLYGDEGTWTAPEGYKYLGELGAEAGKQYRHKRDEAHLFNHGYAYWLATGDPRAAILQQAIAAYMLAAVDVRAPGRYVPRFGYQRTTLNQFSALWKLRDVARNASSRRYMLWPKPRTDKMAADMWAGWKSRLARLDASPDVQNRSVAIFRGIDSNGDNAYSNYMIQAYGPEAAYLWASAGEPALLRRIAENFVLRFGRIGGARGFYGSGKGSGFPILVKGEMPYSDTTSFIAWVNATSDHPTGGFDGAPVHYVQRGYWALRFAADAVSRGWMKPVPGLDEAIKRTEAARDATSKWKYARIFGWKHGGCTF